MRRDFAHEPAVSTCSPQTRRRATRLRKLHAYRLLRAHEAARSTRRRRATGAMARLLIAALRAGRPPRSRLRVAPAQLRRRRRSAAAVAPGRGRRAQRQAPDRALSQGAGGRAARALVHLSSLSQGARLDRPRGRRRSASPMSWPRPPTRRSARRPVGHRPRRR